MPFVVSPEIPPERHAYTLAGGPVGCLMLHGFMGSPKSSRPLGEHLHAHGLTVHCPLLPGHGHLPERLREASHRAWIETAEEGLATLRQHCQEIVLIGHSMGAVLAAHLARPRHAVRALVLIAPLYQPPSRVFYLMRLLRYVQPYVYPLRFKQVDARLIRARVLDFDPTLNLSDPEVQAWLPQATRIPTAALDEMCKMAHFGRQRWSQVQTPTLVLQGDHDPATQPGATEKLFSQLATADKQLRIFARAGHELMRSFDPAHVEAWQMIVAFIQRHTSLAAP